MAARNAPERGGSFIVALWERLCAWLRWITPFQILTTFIPGLRTIASFVDGWVIANLAVAILFSVAMPLARFPFIALIWSIYGALRIFEVIVYQLNVVLFDELRARRESKKYALIGYRRIVLLLMHNYAEMVFWFAGSYRVLADSFNPPIKNWVSALSTSFFTMTSFGPSAPYPVTAIGARIVFVQSIAGAFMTLISLARFLALLPRPASSSVEETEPDGM